MWRPSVTAAQAQSTCTAVELPSSSSEGPGPELRESVLQDDPKNKATATPSPRHIPSAPITIMRKATNPSRSEFPWQSPVQASKPSFVDPNETKVQVKSSKSVRIDVDVDLEGEKNSKRIRHDPITTITPISRTSFIKETHAEVQAGNDSESVPLLPSPVSETLQLEDINMETSLETPNSAPSDITSTSARSASRSVSIDIPPSYHNLSREELRCRLMEKDEEIKKLRKFKDWYKREGPRFERIKTEAVNRYEAIAKDKEMLEGNLRDRDRLIEAQDKEIEKLKEQSSAKAEEDEEKKKIKAKCDALEKRNQALFKDFGKLTDELNKFKQDKSSSIITTQNENKRIKELEEELRAEKQSATDLKLEHDAKIETSKTREEKFKAELSQAKEVIKQLLGCNESLIKDIGIIKEQMVS